MNLSQFKPFKWYSFYDDSIYNQIFERNSTRKSAYNTYRGWTQIKYQNKHYNVEQKDKGTLDDRRRDGGTNYILRIKEKEIRLTLHEHDDDDDDELMCVPFRYS
jgi:hypothetical protein